MIRAQRAERRAPQPEPIRRVRCAIYTRKSNDEGLDGDFSSLDCQRQSAEAYIQSQKHEGWMALADRYDDPAYSAATTDRPALQRLLADVEAGRVDSVIVYKIDRLSRSLRDFGKLMDLFDLHGVSFVSVTQRFDTSSSMGKLTLNILMSFAEFEREVGAERIRDKISGAKKRGKHCGGVPVLGYDVVNKRLVVNPEETKLVVKIFERFTVIQSTTRLARELNEAGHRTKSWPTVTGRAFGGHEWNKADLYKVLNNVKYVGLVEHRDQTYKGEHAAIVSQTLWNQAHKILESNYAERASRTRAETPALLRGVIKCGPCGCAMGPTFTKKRGRTYRYYLCVSASKRGYGTCPVRSVSAGEIESAVIGQLRAAFRTPELIARTYRQAKIRETEELDRLRQERKKFAEAEGDVEVIDQQIHVLEAQSLTERDVIDALQRLDPVWASLFPDEQARIVGLLVERVDVHEDGIELRIRTEGLKSLVAELTAPKEVAG